MNTRIKVIFPLVVISSILLSACGAPATPNATETVAAIYTVAAQTVAARSASFTSTPKPSETPIPSITPTLTVTLTVALASSTSSVPQIVCDNSKYINDITIPDNTVMAPGTVFDKTWSVKNIGSCSWSTSYNLVFIGSEDAMKGVKTSLGQSVAPSQLGNVTVKLTAPLVAGKYVGNWRLVNASGTAFGESLSVVIVVSGDGTMTVTPTQGTVTVTPAETLKPTRTKTPVITVTPTKPAIDPTGTMTLVPTVIPTLVPTGTPTIEPTGTPTPEPTSG